MQRESTYVEKRWTLAPEGVLQMACKMPLGTNACHPEAFLKVHWLAFVSGNRLTITLPESMKMPT